MMPYLIAAGVLAVAVLLIVYVPILADYLAETSTRSYDEPL
jgi:hypothetical protein